MKSFGMSEQQVTRYLHSHGDVHPLPARRSPRQLSVVQREQIPRGVARGEPFRVIATGWGAPTRQSAGVGWRHQDPRGGAQPSD